MSLKNKERIAEKNSMQSKSVYLPVSYWEQLEEIRKIDKTRTNTKIIREAVARMLSKEIENAAPRELPLTMFIPCGEPQTMENLTAPFGEEAKIAVRGAITKFVTPHSFVGIAQGRSMEYTGVDSISNNDRLLMIPKDEFNREIAPGMLVLTQITYKHGGEPKITLKKYADIGKLKANNPKSNAPVPDNDTESFEALAICAGVLEKQFV